MWSVASENGGTPYYGNWGYYEWLWPLSLVTFMNRAFDDFALLVRLFCRSQWPRGLSSRSTARLLRLWVRIPPGGHECFCCECCVLSGRGLCDEPITRPEESCPLWWVVCNLETSRMSRPWPTMGRSTTKKWRLFCISKILTFGLCVNVPVDIIWGSNYEKGPSGRSV